MYGQVNLDCTQTTYTYETRNERYVYNYNKGNV